MNGLDIVTVISLLVIIAISSYSIASMFPHVYSYTVTLHRSNDADLHHSDLMGYAIYMVSRAVCLGISFQYIWIGLVSMLLACYSIAYPLESGFARFDLQVRGTRLSLVVENYIGTVLTIYVSHVIASVITTAIAFYPTLVIYAFAASSSMTLLFLGLASIAYSVSLLIRRVVPSIIVSLAILYGYDTIARSLSLAPYRIMFTTEGNAMYVAVRSSLPILIAGIAMLVATLVYVSRRWEV